MKEYCPSFILQVKSVLQCVLWIIHTTLAHWSGSACPPACSFRFKFIRIYKMQYLQINKKCPFTPAILQE